MIKAVLLFVVCLNFISCYNPKMEPFVVGGKSSNIEDFPHSAYIESFCGKKKIAQCGSSVLNQWILITAAHCVPPTECPSDKRVHARFGHEDKTKGVHGESSAYIYHEDYFSSDDIVQCDIALVLMDKPVKFSRKVGRVAIVRTAVHDEDIVTMAGWGYVQEMLKEKTNLLKECTQKILVRDQCEKRLGKLPEGVFCAMDKWGKSYPARGDSGSALMFEKYIQVGLVSYKTPENPSLIVYTDISYFYDWITANAYKLIFCSTDKSHHNLV